jgi:nucleoid DNA-binding protein
MAKTMVKEDLIEVVKGALGLETKKEAEGFVKGIDAMVEALKNGLEVDQKVKIGKYFTVEKVYKDEKSGVCTGKPFTTPAHEELLIKRCDILKSI